jgi:hypothetical protein
MAVKQYTASNEDILRPDTHKGFPELFRGQESQMWPLATIFILILPRKYGKAKEMQQRMGTISNQKVGWSCWGRRQGFLTLRIPSERVKKIKKSQYKYAVNVTPLTCSLCKILGQASN